ncbi:fibropellin-3-like [Branchiostoma floridae]|uniref:Fibropellin-3-like n=1 Tax=Branchiostoma floridae TaxID=7739 RepID=A0A9J7MLR3_BRAFL|nr:fibropellin-3-like [Branchiostoma floridae]
MTNANVKVTCEAAGMSYPCHYSGGDGCAPHSWTSDCIVYDDAGAGCVTHWVLSANLCGDTDAKQCQPLDETFVYIPNWRSDDSACGVVQDTLWCAYGADYRNMYAVCAAPTCAKCVHGTCTDANGGYTCTCENGWEGTNCDQDINECNNSPCVHGSCIDAIGGYTCTCQNGWEGTNCDLSK